MDSIQKTLSQQKDFNFKCQPLPANTAKYAPGSFQTAKVIAISRLKSAKQWGTAEIIQETMIENGLTCHQATRLYTEALLEELGVLDELESKGVDTAFLRLTEPPPRQPEPEPVDEPTGKENPQLVHSPEPEGEPTGKEPPKERFV